MSKKYGIHNIERISRYCYYAGLGIGFLGLTCMVLFSVLHIPLSGIVPACQFYEVTGYYCPGCGGTRAVMALVHGKIFTSLYYHPFVVYIFAYYIIYEVSHMLDIATHGRMKGLRFCPPYFYAGIILIIVQCAVKNYLRFKYGFTL